MKAKDYLQRFPETIGETTSDEEREKILDIICSCANDLLQEGRDLIKFRKVTGAGMFPVIREINEKWNAFVRLYEKRYGPTCAVLPRRDVIREHFGEVYDKAQAVFMGRWF